MILVTGGTGLVGAHLITALVEESKPVKAIYRSVIPEFPGSNKVTWQQADILDIPALEAAMSGIDQVYHCAAVVSFNPKKRALLSQTNIEGTTNVVNAALTCGVKKLLFVSSVAALGRIRKGQVVNETMHWSKETSNSEYGKTKYLAEMEVWRGDAEGLPCVIVNPTVILGESDWTKGSTGIFKTIHDEFAWYTDGISGFVDVKDVVKAMIMLMESDISGERFILNAENLPYKTLFDYIATGFGKRPPYKKVTPFIANLVWRYEALKGKLTGIDPLLTKETANTAQAKVQFDNAKLLRRFTHFEYTSMSQTVQRICTYLKQKHQL
ncbi:MAG: dihydroflavonol-4-reductase [Chitinophagaceae bacterium]|nr:dihydroflavonol-4-reductase [Chitinophagaceae bacterium]